MMWTNQITTHYHMHNRRLPVRTAVRYQFIPPKNSLASVEPYLKHTNRLHVLLTLFIVQQVHWSVCITTMLFKTWRVSQHHHSGQLSTFVSWASSERLSSSAGPRLLLLAPLHLSPLKSSQCDMEYSCRLWEEEGKEGRSRGEKREREREREREERGEVDLQIVHLLVQCLHSRFILPWARYVLLLIFGALLTWMWSTTSASVFSILTSALLSAFLNRWSKNLALLCGHRPCDPAEWWFFACSSEVYTEGSEDYDYVYMESDSIQPLLV